ncbi:MAG: DUF126 domain-containing protein [Acidimicrobiia bacterium]|nr:DUF126 domain-containing protein [Acidimicrobiia bacterium]NND01889.1 DUF126 domain-containing protein [Acidimicrobiia bacterium]
MPFALGSSSTTSSPAESIHPGTGPACIVMAASDEIIVLGAAVADELYDEWILSWWHTKTTTRCS